ncbi:MAG: hypothetical protein NUV78_03150 [Candidatus Zambryskibacteria bacterium]|nr:hypothetical protein [Candidatus Zambryskibacteria bacterium]
MNKYEPVSVTAKRKGYSKNTVKKYFKLGKVRGVKNINGYIYIEVRDADNKIIKK